MKSLLSLAVVVTLVVSGVPIAAAPQTPLSDFAWASLRATAPGAEVVVTVRGAEPSRRYFVQAAEAELTVLNLSDPALPRDARRLLLDVALHHAAYFASADRRETFVNGNARVGPDGVFVAERKVSDVAHVVERIARPDLIAFRGAALGPNQPATSFGELQGFVKRGDTLSVTDANGRTTKGTLGELSASSLELLVAQRGPNDRTTIVPQPQRSPSDVREIQIVRDDPLWNGLLIGAAPGLGLLALCVSIANGCRYNEYGGENFFRDRFGVMAAVGAGVGLLIDWARKEQVTVYQAPGVRSSAFRVSPLLSKTAAGVQVSVGF